MLRPLLNVVYLYLAELIGEKKLTDQLAAPETPEEEPQDGARRRRKLTAEEIQARREFMRGFA